MDDFIKGLPLISYSALQQFRTYFHTVSIVASSTVRNCELLYHEKNAEKNNSITVLRIARLVCLGL